MHEQIVDAPLNGPRVAAIAAGARLVLVSPTLKRIARSRELVEVIIDRRLRCYGFSAGVGAWCEVPLDRAQQQALSHNIVMSHAGGVGEPLSVHETRAIMACAINNCRYGVRVWVATLRVASMNNHAAALTRAKPLPTRNAKVQPP